MSSQRFTGMPILLCRASARNWRLRGPAYRIATLRRSRLAFATSARTRLADLPVAPHPALSSCVRFVLERLSEQFGPDLYLFEHGVTSGGVACGIDHAHLHVLPHPPEIVESVERQTEVDFPTHRRGSLIDAISIRALERDQSYLLHGSNIGSIQISFSDQIPSQYMRRLVAVTRRRPDWDWKLLSGRAEFLSTREAFR